MQRELLILHLLQQSLDAIEHRLICGARSYGAVVIGLFVDLFALLTHGSSPSGGSRPGHLWDCLQRPNQFVPSTEGGGPRSAQTTLGAMSAKCHERTPSASR